ncbi:bifunctional diaminohydroxyphosphoribosylaminopyrimidine deaminase/5-amino-6-(5-phosphoribosylamino)uracil reductase RibD [Euzebyella saccharophila]|uniref:Riboflavin biosynthesis protein RibD n=1 Tax=Euzebyella saccharophila TaxID=679664 RepID=A0ABV8JZ45_9FLAO|nr:bifunctional diaminohydroxyphosphoribosylaminopyrimidine deaminase/5-amino-6-(5-phosphoribosylamino)uracil reductase RibD [Euzebyella saccharophila]
MKIHRKYMLRCLQIAKNGLGTTAPNPMVGCVIVYDSKIIGEGFTSPYGGPHAEVNAVNSVKNKALLSESTLYVTLEPCSHYGKTPPCADMIIKHQIPKVVIGLLDPHEKVAGKGISKLKDAGVEVSFQIMENECREHHKRFLTFQEKRRPYIILKWAQTSDGFIAPLKDKRDDEPKPYWITNKFSRQLVHQWRSQEQSILVGTKTALEDNPKLDVRQWHGKNPIRVVLDRQLKLGKKSNLLDGTIPTIVFTEQIVEENTSENVSYQRIDFNENLAEQICEILFRNNINSVLIEGGAQTLKCFIDANLWDEAHIFIGNTTFKEGVKAPFISGRLVETRNIAGDQLKTYHND